MIREGVITWEKSVERTHCKWKREAKRGDFLGLLNLLLKLLYTKKDVFLGQSCSPLQCLGFNRKLLPAPSLHLYNPNVGMLLFFTRLWLSAYAMNILSYSADSLSPQKSQYWFPWQICTNTQNKVNLRKSWRGWGKKRMDLIFLSPNKSKIHLY